MQERQARKAEVEDALSSVNPSALRIHPNLQNLYERKVRELEQALNDDSIRNEASELLRSLIDRVVLKSAADALEGIEAELHGDLAAIIAITQDLGSSKQTPRPCWTGESTVGGCGGPQSPTVDSPTDSRLTPDRLQKPRNRFLPPAAGHPLRLAIAPIAPGRTGTQFRCYIKPGCANGGRSHHRICPTRQPYGATRDTSPATTAARSSASVRSERPLAFLRRLVWRRRSALLDSRRRQL
jgi:hypothetical protein